MGPIEQPDVLTRIANGKPSSADDVCLDVVTPTYDRPAELLGLAKALRPQLRRNDRWIVVDDASPEPVGYSALEAALGPECPAPLLYVPLSYRRIESAFGTVQYARHISVSCFRPHAWVVEIDDHDWPEADALDLVRAALCGGAAFVYGDVCWCDENGDDKRIFRKPDYTPYLLRDSLCPAEGVRAFPKWLYDLAGGYRWSGPLGLHGCEFPAGDYCLYTRMELITGGRGFHRIPRVLNRQPKTPESISVRFFNEQADMARRVREAARAGTLLQWPAA
jgi:hypothetical protein